MAISVTCVLFFVYFFLGYMPETSEIQLADGATGFLPFELSRWWDIVFAPIFWLMPLFWLCKKNAKIETASLSIDGGMFVGQILSVIYFLSSDLLFCLKVFAVFGFVLTLGATLFHKYISGLKFTLAFCLTIGSIPGIIHSFVIVPFLVLFAAAVCFSGILAGFVIKFLYWFFWYRLRFGRNWEFHLPLLWQW
jgi:hypothetical protein